MLFPSDQWLDEYRERLNDDDEYSEYASGWGVDFNGDFVFVVEELPVDEIDIDALPGDIQDLLEEYVDSENRGYAFIGLTDGNCTDARLVKNPDDVTHGFRLIATYNQWKELINGKIKPTEGLMSGALELEGDMQKVMQYTQGAERLAEVASEIDTEYIDDEY